MRIILCDRCKKRMTQAKKTGYVNLDWRDVKTGDLEGKPNELDDWDFCEECMAEISEFVRMKPAVAAAPVHADQDPVQEKPKATIKRPIADGSKWAPVTPEKIERIKALAREGKTVKEIVEETGVSDPTVRKYKREVDNETNLQELREVPADL